MPTMTMTYSHHGAHLLGLARMRLLADDRPLAAVAALVEEVLPLDAERRTEARVWAAFTLPPVTGPGIDALRAQVDAGVRDLCGNALDALHELDQLHVERDRRIEIARLQALLDGLTLHLTAEPPRIRPAEARAVVLAHVGDLATPPRT